MNWFGKRKQLAVEPVPELTGPVRELTGIEKHWLDLESEQRAATAAREVAERQSNIELLAKLEAEHGDAIAQINQLRAILYPDPVTEYADFIDASLMLQAHYQRLDYNYQSPRYGLISAIHSLGLGL